MFSEQTLPLPLNVIFGLNPTEQKLNQELGVGLTRIHKLIINYQVILINLIQDKIIGIHQN
jgi:hypothetical protein